MPTTKPASHPACLKCKDQEAKRETAKRKKEENKSKPEIEQARTKAAKIAKAAPKQIEALAQLRRDFAGDGQIVTDCSNFLLAGQKGMDQITHATTEGAPALHVKNGVSEATERLKGLCEMAKTLSENDMEGIATDAGLENDLRHIADQVQTLSALVNAKKEADDE